jgi:RecJ-like exonuclease
VPCTQCNGTGRDTVARLASARYDTVEHTLALIAEGRINIHGLDSAAGTYHCYACNGAGTITSMGTREVPVGIPADYDERTTRTGAQE